MAFTRRSLPILFTSLLLRGQGTVSDAELSRFNSWLRGDGVNLLRDRAPLPELLGTYRQQLLHDGMKPGDADDLVSRLRKRLGEAAVTSAPSDTRELTNRLYSSLQGQEESRTTQPNAFLVETVATLRPGKALDLGMGLGRNSIFLAQKGWDVTGIDLSDVGIAGAQERARRLGVQMKAIVADVNRFELGTDDWDLVCVLYFIIDENMPNLHQRVANAVKPGGLVVVEGVGPGGLDGLLRAWSKWEPTRVHLLRLEYREGRSDWGGTHVTRLLLQKPV